MSVDFLPKNFPPFQVHHAKKPPRFYPDGFQRNVIDFYLFFRIVGSEKPYICSFPILYGPYGGLLLYLVGFKGMYLGGGWAVKMPGRQVRR